METENKQNWKWNVIKRENNSKFTPLAGQLTNLGLLEAQLIGAGLVSVTRFMEKKRGSWILKI